MSNAFSLWSLYVTTVGQAQGAPIIDRGCTRELEGAMRQGRCIVIRPPFMRHRPCRALVLGIWLKPKEPIGPSVGPELGHGPERGQ